MPHYNNLTFMVFVCFVWAMIGCDLNLSSTDDDTQTFADVNAKWFTGTTGPAPSQGVNGDLYMNTSTGEIFLKLSGGWVLSGNVTGPPGTDGADGSDGASWLTGTTVPSVLLGSDADLYINTSTGDIYVKTSGAWVLSGNLTGPAGADGTDGAAGPPGLSGEMLFFDDFDRANLTDTQNGLVWYAWNPGSVQLMNGELLIVSDSTQYVSTANLYISPTISDSSDYMIEVDAEWVPGTQHNSYGIAVRNTGGSNQIRLSVDDDGAYWIGDGITPIVNWTATTVIRPGESNRLSIRAIGSAFDFYINGELMESIVSSAHPNGTIYLGIGGIQSVRFDNLLITIYQPTAIGL